MVIEGEKRQLVVKKTAVKKAATGKAAGRHTSQIRGTSPVAQVSMEDMRQSPITTSLVYRTPEKKTCRKKAVPPTGPWKRKRHTALN